MIRRALGVMVGVCLLFGPAAAQEAVSLRAGEHSTYSRIAVPIPPEATWEFTTFGRQANLRIPQTETDFDVSDVFDRIPKTRVLNINTSQAGGATEIQLTLACPCPAKATLSGRYLLIDVYDPDTALPSFEEPDDTPASTTPASEENALSSARAPSRRPEASGQEVMETVTPTQADVTEARIQSSAPSDPQTTEVTTPADTAQEAGQPTPDADGVADLLIQQLQRAADQGLVELQPEPAPQPNPEPEPATLEIEPGPEPSLQPYEENADGMEALASRLQRALEGTDGASITDAIRLQLPEERPTRPAPPIRRPEPVASSEQTRPEHCLDDYYYDFSVLEPGRKPIEQIIDLRSRLLGEFDDPDATTALELTRLYIALGMGVEARALTKEFVTDERQRTVLDELAQVVEGTELSPGSSLDAAAGCPGPAAIWRTAGMSKSETQPVPEPQVIVNALAELPVELRRRLVPRIVASFIVRDQINAAEASFAILERAPGNHGPEHEFQRAALLRLGGQIEDAEAVYLRLSARADPSGPRALVALVESLVDRGKRVPPRLIEDTATMARQFRDDPLGPALRHAEILARAGNGRFGEALDVVSAEIENNPEIADDYLAVAQRLFEETKSQSVGSGRYATAIFDNMDMLKRSSISGEARLNVARELIEIGLPGAVPELVAAPVSASANGTDPGARVALAQAYLSLDEPERALETLAGDLTPLEARIRVAALTKLGRHGAALAEANLLEDADNIAALGFRAGEWNLAANAQNLNGALARYMLRQDEAIPSASELEVANDPDLRAVETPTAPIDSITLKQAEAMRTQSQSIRRVLTAELGEPG